MRLILTISFMLVLTACGPENEGTTAPEAGTDAGSTNGPVSDAGSDAATDETSADADAEDATVETDMPDAQPVDISPLDVMDRPADVFVPSDYDSANSYPLVVLLHGYSATAQLQDFYFGTSMRVDERDFILVTPSGTQNPENKRFWNAYWCCDFYDQNIDDVAYIAGLIEAAKERYSVDERRVYLMGHSNGGFMSYRIACEVPGITAIMSLAGSGPEEEADCSAAGNVSVLQVHGTLDSVIRFDGVVGQYPSASEMTRRWAARNGCDPEPTVGDPLDLIRALPDEETTVERWTNCDAGTAVALWTINDGAHIPAPNDNFKDGILDFFFALEAP